MGSEESAEVSTTTSDYAQYSDTPSSFDVERQATPRSLGPQQKYPKTCPSCGEQLDEAVLKQLIISGKVTCTFCGNLIQIK